MEATMKKLSVVTMTVFSFLVGPVFCQTLEPEPKTSYGYAFVTPGVVTGDGASATLTLGAGAEGLIKGGLGISADVGYMYFPREGFRSGVGIFSPGVVCQFHTRRKTVPFVTGGYTLAFRSGAYNLFHFGGGVNHWFSNRWGIRLEGRDHIDPHYREYNFVQFRVGFLFR
jgi:hypothetical protein